MEGSMDTHADAAQQRRRFRINLTIFLAVNLVLLLAAAILYVAGLRFAGELWPYPLVMAAWAAWIAIQGFSAYGRHEP
jgi:hypothetical protein